MQTTTTKWADYVIVAVRYDIYHNHIEKVRVASDLGSSLGTMSDWTRQEVVQQIEQYKTFVTARMGSNGYIKGEDVRVVVINYRKYIRTDANRTEKDNLGELPEF